MKRLSFLLVAVFVATSAMFVSCGEDEIFDEPTILVRFNGANSADGVIDVPALNDGEVVGSVNVEVIFKADGGLSLARIARVGSNGPEVSGYSGAGKTEGFEPSAKEDNKAVWTVERNAPNADGSYAAYKVEYNVEAVDAQKGENQKRSPIVKIEINFAAYSPSTPLVAGTDFTLTYVNINQTNGANINATVGIKYAGNLPGNLGNFVIEPANGNKFVKLANKAAHDEILDKETLKARYDSNATSASAVESLEVGADAAFAAVYFISKVEDNYFLVAMKSLNFAAGNNQAVFGYKY